MDESVPGDVEEAAELTAANAATVVPAGVTGQEPAPALSAPPGASIMATVIALGGIQALAIGFTLIRSKAVALLLGPSGVGLFSIVDQMVGLAMQLVAFSLPFAAVKFLSAAHSAGRRAFAELYAGFFWALLALSGAGSLAVLLVLRLWPALLGPELAPYGRATALAVLAIPGMVLVTLCGNAIAAAQRARTSGGYGLLNTAALAVLPTLGVVAGGVTGYYAGALLAVAAVAACGVLYLARSEGVLVGPPQLGVATLRRCRGLGTFAASLYIMALALPATHLLARYTILRTSGLEAAGLLQSAMAGGLAFALVMRQSNALFLTPAMNRHTPAEQKFREAAEYLRSFSLVAGLVALPLVLFPEVALYVLYSRRFLSAAPYAYLFVVAQLLEVIGGVLLGILIGLDRIVAQLAITLTGITALAVLAVTLGPRFGLAGIGVAFLADGVLVLAVSAWLLQRQYGFNLLADCGGIPLGVLATLAAAGAWAAHAPPVWSPRLAAMKFAVLAALALAGGLLALRLHVVGGWRRPPYRLEGWR